MQHAPPSETALFTQIFVGREIAFAEWVFRSYIIAFAVGCSQHAKGEGWGVLWNGQKAGGLSLRVKRDERVGAWWLSGLDVSVMAWCQTICHCQCLPHQPIPLWSMLQNQGCY